MRSFTRRPPTALQALLRATKRSSLRARRLRAEREVERISELSPALLAVAGFDGYLREFNPAFEVFGYSREELLSRPWVEFAHPDDRERMLQAAESLERGVDVMEVVNRIVCRDGSLRWVEWRTRVLPEEGLFYAAGRDLTESHHAAEEQAALRRVATVAAQGAKPADVFHAVAEELGRLLDAGSSGLVRFDAGDTATLVAGWGRLGEAVPDGARLPLGGENVLSRIAATGQAARVDEYERTASGTIAQRARLVDTTSAVGSPVIVAGRVWGAMVASVLAGSTMPADAVRRVEQFTELDRDRDREHRSADAAWAPGRRAGGAQARGHARRRRGTGPRAVRQGRGGGGRHLR